MVQARTIRLWSRIHTWTSLVCMLFLLMLCVTGLPLVFHDEIDDLLDDEIAAPAMPAGTARLSLDRMIAAAQARFPGQYVLLLNLKQTEPLVTVAVSPTAIPAPGSFHRLTLDARTAEVLGEEAPHQDVMDIVLRIHKDMFAGLPGELFLGGMGPSVRSVDHIRCGRVLAVHAAARFRHDPPALVATRQMARHP
ncbi:putative iron-regulated membrane protein [Bradyrhizobium ottawaense]